MISGSDEKQIWDRAVTFLRRGRPGDVEHTSTVLTYGKTLVANEGGNPLVVIPTLILHDVGWSQVDFSDFISAPPEAKPDVESVRLHMRRGAQIANDVLNDLGWQPELIRRITRIIAVHDVPEEIRAMDDLDATLVFEADWLDKYEPSRLRRYFEGVHDATALKELQELLDMHKSQLFRTTTAKQLLERICTSSRA
ncbi:MAG: HD domain-containing protein [Desulfomonilaceae bacterium]